MGEHHHPKIFPKWIWEPVLPFEESFLVPLHFAQDLMCPWTGICEMENAKQTSCCPTLNFSCASCVVLSGITGEFPWMKEKHRCCRLAAPFQPCGLQPI